MINICVLSSDLVFAEMLCAELEEIKEIAAVCVNQYREGSIVVLDLDSDGWSASISQSDDIIGFSRNEKAVSKSLLNKCHSVMHRPFLIDEMKNTVQRLLAKKNGDESVEPASDKQDRLRFDKDCVYLDEKRIGLSENEYALLSLLYEKNAMPVSRGEICEVLSSSDGNICDVYICRLRSKIEKGGSEKLIFTVRGKGYMLKI